MDFCNIGMEYSRSNIQMPAWCEMRAERAALWPPGVACLRFVIAPWPNALAEPPAYAYQFGVLTWGCPQASYFLLFS